VLHYGSRGSHWFAWGVRMHTPCIPGDLGSETSLRVKKSIFQHSFGLWDTQMAEKRPKRPQKMFLRSHDGLTAYLRLQPGYAAWYQNRILDVTPSFLRVERAGKGVSALAPNPRSLELPDFLFGACGAVIG